MVINKLAIEFLRGKWPLWFWTEKRKGSWNKYQHNISVQEKSKKKRQAYETPKKKNPI